MFIILTDIKGDKIRLNVFHIIGYELCVDFSVVRLIEGDNLHATETPDEIDHILMSNNVTVARFQKISLPASSENNVN